MITGQIITAIKGCNLLPYRSPFLVYYCEIYTSYRVMSFSRVFRDSLHHHGFLVVIVIDTDIVQWLPNDRSALETRADNCDRATTDTIRPGISRHRINIRWTPDKTGAGDRPVYPVPIYL